jgi:hypothetical protein
MNKAAGFQALRLFLQADFHREAHPYTDIDSIHLCLTIANLKGKR